jgi:hypothetical protein
VAKEIFLAAEPLSLAPAPRWFNVEATSFAPEPEWIDRKANCLLA